MWYELIMFWTTYVFMALKVLASLPALFFTLIRKMWVANQMAIFGDFWGVKALAMAHDM